MRLHLHIGQDWRKEVMSDTFYREIQIILSLVFYERSHSSYLPSTAILMSLHKSRRLNAKLAVFLLKYISIFHCLNL